MWAIKSWVTSLASLWNQWGEKKIATFTLLIYLWKVVIVLVLLKVIPVCPISKLISCSFFAYRWFKITHKMWENCAQKQYKTRELSVCAHIRKEKNTAKSLKVCICSYAQAVRSLYRFALKHEVLACYPLTKTN